MLYDIKTIRANPNQPRKNFDKKSIEELANSIRQQGLLVPILIKKDDNNKNFLIVAGERRWRASKLAGIKKIKAIVIDNKKIDSALISIIENVQREDLSVIEEAEAYNKLILDFKMTHEEIAKKTGKSRSYITNIVRILGLSTKVRKHLEDGIISFGHARALLGAEKQDELVDIVVNNSLNVRSTEDLIKEKSLTNIKIGNKKNLHSDRRDPNILDYEKYLSLKLGYKVEIKDKSGKGHILVKYKTLDQLEAIIEIFNK